MKKLMKKVRKIIFVICLMIIIIYIMKNSIYYVKNELNKSLPVEGSSNDIFGIIKLDNNTNYEGIGQERINNKDGYFTTFTTTQKNKKIYKEYKQNGTCSWSNNTYWEGTMADNGCAITAMSIILSGYGKNYTPEDLRKMYYPKLDGNNISNELSNTFNIENTDFLYNDKYLCKSYIKEYLKTNRPILVCVWNKPNENRWTTTSHYMVLLATDGDKMAYVSNPNGLDNTSKSSGWYDLDEITQYIAKALFIESYK